MNGVEINLQAEGLSAHCPCRGCAACGVFWVRQVPAGRCFGEGVFERPTPWRSRLRITVRVSWPS